MTVKKTNKYTNSDLLFLLKLLEDPDEKVYNEIKLKVYENPETFKIFIEENWVNLANSLAIKRAENLLMEISLNETVNNIIAWKKDENSYVSDALLIIEKFFDNTTDENDIINNVNSIVSELWLELNDQLTALEKVKLVNHTLYVSNKFKYISNRNTDYYTVNFSKFLDNKEFIDSTITLLYVIICEKLELPIKLLNINLAGYSVLGYIDAALAKAVFNKHDNNVVFYILPTFNGEVWSQAQLLSFSEKKNITLDPNKIKVLTNQQVVKNWAKLKSEVIVKSGKQSFAAENIKTVLQNIS